ncbi:MAG TPA: hypothetical protein VK586_01465 [Streptosporangiaceae bacterium]|nr:hypothetical protein [Streptosporangiaceae bacterium]
MTDGAVMRTEYWNISTGTVRTGPTGHGESLTDMESYLLPMDRARDSGLYSWGVADGLAVQGTAGAPGVTVMPGTALDAAGRLIVLPAGGTVIVDPTVDPAQVSDVPTVPVDATGVSLPTAGAAADSLLTLTWREAEAASSLANAPVLLHAPWLRLIPAAGFADDGGQVVLAAVQLDGAGNLASLSAGPRRPVGIPAGRLELRVPRLRTGAAPAVGDHAVADQAAAELTVSQDGSVALSLLSQAAPITALAIDGQAGDVTLPGSLTTFSALRLLSVRALRTYEMSAGPHGSWAVSDTTANADRLVIDPTGNVGIGVPAGQAERIVHVEGTEVHSGGAGGGFSFADRAVGSVVDNPAHGERWIWYALDGTARLWSGSDQATVSSEIPGDGTGLTVGRRMRVQQGPDGSAGIWFQQENSDDNAFVGMLDGEHVGFYGASGAGWGLTMDTASGEVQFDGNFGQPNGASTLSLFGSQIGDTGGGVLFIRSGGGVVSFDGGDSVGINTRTPQSSLDVQGPGTAITGRAGGAVSTIGVHGIGYIGLQGEGQFGMVATGAVLAGSFNGRVQVTADLTVGGSIRKGGGGFRIDHPADPAGKYLSHSFVESPDMLNVYAGTAVTGDDGTVTVALPDFFEALNREHRFQLTPVGELALATVDGPVQENSFAIRTDRPGVTVCWQVTGVRQDKWAQAHRIPVEEDKPDGERDRFLHPDLHGQPADRGVLGAPAEMTENPGG